MQRNVDTNIPAASIGLFLDLYILIVPIIGVWGLNMPLNRKIGVILTFLSGLV
jgi:hypothetical protein